MAQMRCWAESTASSFPAASACAASRARSRRSASPGRRQIPFFGICLGMQCAVIEFARSVLGLEDANSTEFDKTTDHPVIALMEDPAPVQQLGRHDAAGRLAMHAGTRQPGPTRPMAPNRSTSAIAIAMSSIMITAKAFEQHGLIAVGNQPRRRHRRDRRAAQSPVVPGRAVPSRVSSPSRPRRIRSSATSSVPHSSAERQAD